MHFSRSRLPQVEFLDSNLDEKNLQLANHANNVHPLAELDLKDLLQITAIEEHVHDLLFIIVLCHASLNDGVVLVGGALIHQQTCFAISILMLNLHSKPSLHSNTHWSKHTTKYMKQSTNGL